MGQNKTELELECRWILHFELARDRANRGKRGRCLCHLINHDAVDGGLHENFEKVGFCYSDQMVGRK